MDEPEAGGLPRMGKIVFAWTVFLGCAVLLVVALMPDRGNGDWTCAAEESSCREKEAARALSPEAAREPYRCPPMRLLFWNVRAYSAGPANDGEMPGAGQGRTVRREKPEQDRERVARAIAREDADIVVLAEIMGDRALTDLRERLRKRGREYKYAETLFLDFSGREPGLALLSRIPLEDSRSESRIPLPGGGEMMRGILDVRLVSGTGRKTRILAVHLKSSFGDREKSGLLRRAEAAVLRERLDNMSRREPGTPAVLCGDFNDAPSSPVLKTVAGRRGEPGYMRRLDPEDSRGERWTHYFPAEDAYTRLDYIFVRGGRTEGDGSVFRAFLAEGADVSGASDHRPLILNVTDR